MKIARVVRIETDDGLESHARALRQRFRLTAFSMGDGRVPAVPRRCRPSGARWSGEAYKAGSLSKNHGARRNRRFWRRHGGVKTGV